MTHASDEHSPNTSAHAEFSDVPSSAQPVEPVEFEGFAEYVEPVESAEHEEPASRSSRLGATLGTDFDAWQALGGTRGLIESNVPALIFVVTYIATRDMKISVIAPLIFSVFAVVVRLIQRIDPVPALGGVGMVAVSAGFAYFSGRSEAYFLPGILTNSAYAIIVGISLIAKYPALGFVMGMLRGDLSHWRTSSHPVALATRATYQKITWIWFAMFALRAIIQIPLYRGGYTASLSVIKIVCGPVLFCAVLWATWLLVRRLPPVKDYLRVQP